MRRTLARHHIIEFTGCDPRLLDSATGVTRAVRRLCRDAGLHPVRFAAHRFSPHGLTLLGILRESHLAYSSWPEHGYAMLCLQLCGPASRLDGAVGAFGRALAAGRVRRRSWAIGLR